MNSTGFNRSVKDKGDVKSKIDNVVSNSNASNWLEIKKIESRAVESKRRANSRE